MFRETCNSRNVSLFDKIITQRYEISLTFCFPVPVNEILFRNVLLRCFTLYFAPGSLSLCLDMFLPLGFSSFSPTKGLGLARPRYCVS